MKTEYVYTALIDVLSYRHRLNVDIQNGREDFRLILEQSIAVFDSVNTAVFGVQAISDTIIMTCNSHDNFLEFLSILRRVFVSFLEKGLFIRGGVAYSRHFQSGRITYSHAIARAYELESRESIYPRIVFDKNIIEMYATSGQLPDLFGKGFVVTHNGVSYLNVIEASNWNSIYNSASKIYEGDREYLDGNELAFLKHVWFEKYLFESTYVDEEKSKYIKGPEFL